MSRKKRRWLGFGGLAVAAIVGWNALALQPELFVLRKMLRDPDVVYVIEGARPFTHWCLRGEKVTIASGSVADPDDPFRTRDGKPIMYLQLDGVMPTGWMRFRVNAGYLAGPLYGQGDAITVVWEPGGWRIVSTEIAWES